MKLRWLLTVLLLTTLPAAGWGQCSACGEGSCVPVQAAYISHFTGANCTGEEHYYTPYFNSDGIRRSWDGAGCVGTTLRTVTNRSWKGTDGACHNDWPGGNTLSGFVKVYRGSGCVADACTTCNRTSWVNDSDGIPDTLEYDLAHAFFPSVILKDVESDLRQAYLYQGKAIPFTVEPLNPARGICDEAFECLEIRYGLAYFQDFGDSLASGHLGDSEFYAALVQRTAPWSTAQSNVGSWQLIRDFTAAHWGEPLVDSSVLGAYGNCPPNCSASTSSASCLQQSACAWEPGYCDGIPDPASGERSCFRQNTPEWCYSSGCTWQWSFCYPKEPAACYSTAPAAGFVTLYASEKKHALYHSDAECDNGGFHWPVPFGEGEDECPNTNLYSLRSFKGELLQNVGNASFPSPDTTIQHPDKCRLYNVWSVDKFGSSSTTAYSVHFKAVLPWIRP